MRLRPVTLLLILVLPIVAALATAWLAWHPGPNTGTWLLFDGRSSPRPIGLGASASNPTAQTAAAHLRDTLAAVSGQRVAAFPVRTASDPAPIVLEVRPGGDALFERQVGYDVSADGVRIWARHAEDLRGAASVFLERELGVRWFMPGDLGRESTPRRVQRLKFGSYQTTPSFAYRNFSPRGSGVSADWAANNRLAGLLPHHHSVETYITRADMLAESRLAPWFNGSRFVPAKEGDQGWQPDLTSEVIADHVSARIGAEFRAHPQKRAVTFAQNDTWRWDQSDATLAEVAPHRHFRKFPVYSDTLFGFLNRVASRLEAEFPDRLITTYAYQWTEQVPKFPVHRNVVPFLTSDRSQWFDTEFKAEDQDLIRRWVKAGPRLVGTYDYYYGSPFFVPRPTLYAITDSIPFLHQAGIRAFYAEVYPNWALDGPKAWLAAQLLWDATQDPQALLDEYYTRYWKEAAASMRRFFEICDRQYLQQPKPGYWIKFFRDDHQRILFPPEVRRELFACLDEASALARLPVVRQRLAATRAAFTVSDLFCRHGEQRDFLSNLCLQPAADPEELRSAIAAYTETRLALIDAHEKLKRDHPLALSADLITNYLRQDPRARALRQLALAGKALPPIDAKHLAAVFDGRLPDRSELTGLGPELLQDAALATVRPKKVHPFTAVDWNEPGGPWRGISEPFETRQAQILPLPTDGHALRFSGVSMEGLYQGVPAEPGALYTAQVRVRGKVSPGNLTYLSLIFADRAGKRLVPHHVERLPMGDFPEWVTLEVVLRAPQGTEFAWFGLHAVCQVGDDQVEFAAPSLRRLGPADPRR